MTTDKQLQPGQTISYRRGLPDLCDKNAPVQLADDFPYTGEVLEIRAVTAVVRSDNDKLYIVLLSDIREPIE